MSIADNERQIEKIDQLLEALDNGTWRPFDAGHTDDQRTEPATSPGREDTRPASQEK
jgi:hypothetical protein